MHPVLFEIPFTDYPLRSFGVLVAAGFLLGLWLWSLLLRRYGEDPAGDPERASQVALWLLVGVLAGARVMYVAVEAGQYLGTDVTPAMEKYLDSDERGRTANQIPPDELVRAKEVVVGHDFVNDPLKCFFIWQGGLVMYGGFFGAIALGWWASRRRGLNPKNALDTCVVAGFVGQAVGRWGCLLVGDDYGSIVPERFRDLPFPITLTVPSLEWLQANPHSLFDHKLAGEVLWATQPWMSFNALMVAGVGYLVLRRRRYYGQVGAVVLVHYSITRFIIEMFRGDEIRGTWLGGTLSTSQLVSIPGVLLGLWILWRCRGRRDSFPEA